MSPYLAVLLLAGIALIQMTLAPHLSIMGGRPQFMLLTVVSWALLRGGREGAVWGFAGGVMLDLLSGAPFGVITLSLLLVGYLSGLGEINVFRANFLLPAFVVLVATLLYNAVILLLLQLLGQSVLWESALLHVILPTVLLNVLILPLFYLPLRRVHRLAAQPQVSM
ncbi:MAG: rod shape-determining protein MreD [Anaerolineae bacterium]